LRQITVGRYFDVVDHAIADASELRLIAMPAAATAV
jgi:hypothetical protein